MKAITYISIVCTSLFLFSACQDKNEKTDIILNTSTLDTDGIGYVISQNDATMVYNAIISALKTNENIKIVAEVDHSKNAQNLGLSLEYTRTVYFGNPELGTPIMQDNIKAGLDLPQRITVFINEDKNTVITYNSIDYVIERHELGTVATTDMIDTALANIVNDATKEEVSVNKQNAIETDGILSVTSKNDFDRTYNKLLATLNGLEPITVIAELDHQANAQAVNLYLRPAKLILFGNPVLGTPLMEESKTIALDLPQKMLVYEDSNGEVVIIYNDPFYLAKRHGIKDNNDSLTKIAQALQTIAASGVSNGITNTF